MIRTARRRFVLALFGVALALMAALAPAAAQLTVGVQSDNRPWEFTDASGASVGFNIDMTRALGKQLGVGIALQPMGFSELFQALEAGRVDAVVSSITVTPQRLARFDFTQPYYRTAQAVVVLKSAGIRDMAGLAGKVVATAAHSTNESWLEANKARYGIATVRHIDTVAEAMALLRSGAIAAFFDDEPALLYELLQSRDLAVIARLSSDDRYAILLRRGSPWTARLDAALSQLKTGSVLAAIHRKWFGTLPPEDSPTSIVLPRP